MVGKNEEEAVVHAARLAADLSHLTNKVKVSAYAFDKQDKAIGKAGGDCLTECHLVGTSGSTSQAREGSQGTPEHQRGHLQEHRGVCQVRL